VGEGFFETKNRISVVNIKVNCGREKESRFLRFFQGRRSLFVQNKKPGFWGESQI
jgi:hypothetical protein